VYKFEQNDLKNYNKTLTYINKMKYVYLSSLKVYSHLSSIKILRISKVKIIDNNQTN